jgi:hypothetical protein
MLSRHGPRTHTMDHRSVAFDYRKSKCWQWQRKVDPIEMDGRTSTSTPLAGQVNGHLKSNALGLVRPVSRASEGEADGLAHDTLSEGGTSKDLEACICNLPL